MSVGTDLCVTTRIIFYLAVENKKKLLSAYHHFFLWSAKDECIDCLSSFRCCRRRRCRRHHGNYGSIWRNL